MNRLHCILVLLLLAGVTGCSNKEQVYEGMYQGLSSASENQMTRDPSYDPVQAQERKKQSYHEYKREREQFKSE